MNANQLLAVNEAVRRKGDESSPYALTKDRLVPRFAESEGPVPSVAYVRAQPHKNEADYRVSAKAVFQPSSGSHWSAALDGKNKNRRRSLVRQPQNFKGISVMRNDLSESDFEVVSAKSTSAHKPVASLKSTEAKVRGRWGRLGARLLGIGTRWFKAQA